MRVLIEHDANGKIMSVLAPVGGEEADVHLTFEPRPGCMVTEVEVPHITEEKDIKKLQALLYTLRTRYRIDMREGDREYSVVSL